MQNNVGLQTAYWSGTTPALDIHQIIELTKKANMDTIELKAGDFVPLTTEGRAALRKEIEDAGLSISTPLKLNSTLHLPSVKFSLFKNG